MLQSSNHSLPLLVTDEKEAMLTSIVNMLRQKGFTVVRQELSLEAIAQQNLSLNLDGLNLLRYVTQNWDKTTPVVISSEPQIETKKQNSKLAA